MENSDSILVTYAKNLAKQNFSSQISVQVDNNVNIKTILNIDSYLFDVKLECASGKAIMSGKIGVKVLYLDVDNILNTVTDSTNFSETILDGAITADSSINVCDYSLLNTVVSAEGSLKINVELAVNPTLYLNIGLPKKNNFENMIVKKTEIDTSTISKVVDSAFEYSVNMETKDNVSKILNYNAHFTAENVSAYENYAVVEGKLFGTLVYETNKDDVSEIKELSDTFNIKTELQIEGLTKESVLDLSFNMDKSKFNISTEIEDGNCEITITHPIRAYGIAVKQISIDVVDDLYSTDNEVELTRTSREFLGAVKCEKVEELVSGEVNLADDEPAIEQVLCNQNISPEITNTYIKDGVLYVEGLVTSHLTYVNENKEYQHKQTELPFVINTKINLQSLDCVHTSVSVCDGKVRVRRGTIIELEYVLHLNFAIYQKTSREMIDGISIGRAVDFSEYDYQIYIGKPSETLWELSKRIKIAPDDLLKYNSSLPETLEGGEKIVIKR